MYVSLQSRHYYHRHHLTITSTILVRFEKGEEMKDSKRLDCRSTVVICLLIALPLAYYADFQIDRWKGKLSNWGGNLGIRKVKKGEDPKEPLEFLLRSFVRGQAHIQPEASKFACHSDMNSDICVASEQVRIDTRTMTIYVPSNSASRMSQLNVQPYARKEDETAMKQVSSVQIRHGNIKAPACNYFHDVPAVVFSSGVTGNSFHEFNEIMIPLFITCSHFRSQLCFVVSDFKSWFIRKYDQIFSHLSRYEVIDASANGIVHCFPGAVIGLVYHDNLAVNISDIPGRYTMHDFKQFLRQSFNLKYKDMLFVSKKPKLLLISRRETRVLLNENEMVKMMEKLGFEVIIALASNMSNVEKFSQVVNSCSVMVGAHGAGLTNELFLPAGAVVVQVVSLGLDWAANAYYGAPSKDMDLQYLEYKIKPEESSLYDLYGPDHPVIADPASIFAKGYRAVRAVYVDGQNMTIHVERFRETLVEAMRLLGR